MILEMISKYLRDKVKGFHIRVVYTWQKGIFLEAGRSLTL
jgi:hypothetical protein